MMDETTHLYGDHWGEIIGRPALEIVELRWFDTTAEMSALEFQSWLTTFADHVTRSGHHRVLVDGTSFLMAPAFMDAAWRDEHIIPQYNGAGVTKFAFHMPTGMPAIGAPPALEPPGTFPTGYFGSRQSALTWLTA